MKLRTQAMIILATSALGVVALAVTILAPFASENSAYAASQPMFTVTGSAREIATASDYSDPGTVVIDTSHVPIRLANVRHYVILGTLRPDGSYDYPVGITMAPGVRAAAMLVAMNPHTHVEVIDVGTEQVNTATTKA